MRPFAISAVIHDGASSTEGKFYVIANKVGVDGDRGRGPPAG